jgi:hypothetical protein
VAVARHLNIVEATHFRSCRKLQNGLTRDRTKA